MEKPSTSLPGQVLDGNNVEPWKRRSAWVPTLVSGPLRHVGQKQQAYAQCGGFSWVWATVGNCFPEVNWVPERHACIQARDTCEYICWCSWPRRNHTRWRDPDLRKKNRMVKGNLGGEAHRQGSCICRAVCTPCKPSRRNRSLALPSSFTTASACQTDGDSSCETSNHRWPHGAEVGAASETWVELFWRKITSYWLTKVPINENSPRGLGCLVHLPGVPLESSLLPWVWIYGKANLRDTGDFRPSAATSECLGPRGWKTAKQYREGTISFYFWSTNPHDPGSSFFIVPSARP